jgi:hypothetical protein
MRAIVLGLAVLVSACGEKPELAACDAAIQARLKSPASYKRVSAVGDAKDGLGTLTISYDAVNSFNAPLRSSGTCFLLDGKATWFEDLKASG